MKESDFLIAAFCAERRLRDSSDHRFGRPSLRVAGISDGNEGVQWNAWVEWGNNEQMAFVGVNLEGKAYDGWPIGRLIKRELDAPRLFEVIGRVPHPERVEVIWYRDAWQFAARPIIEETWIGGSPHLLHNVTPEHWAEVLREAGDCLGPGFHGRTKQLVTVKRGPAEFEVSPHFQFRRRFWPREAATLNGWSAAMRELFSAMQPLYEFVEDRARA